MSERLPSRQTTEPKPDSPRWWENWDLNYVTTQYGKIYGAGSVLEATYRTLEKWLPSYVSEFNRQIKADVLQTPIYRQNLPEYDTLSADSNQPRLIATVPHTIGNVGQLGRSYQVTWRLSVEVYLYGTTDWQETQAMTMAYAAMVRTLLVQNQTLGGLARSVIFESEEYYEGEHTSTRTTGITVLHFAVVVDNVQTIDGPPVVGDPYLGANATTAPSSSPLPPDPMAETSEVTVTNTPVQMDPEWLSLN
jgi:hypothetical protein